MLIVVIFREREEEKRVLLRGRILVCGRREGRREVGCVLFALLVVQCSLVQDQPRFFRRSPIVLNLGGEKTWECLVSLGEYSIVFSVSGNITGELMDVCWSNYYGRWKRLVTRTEILEIR